MELSNRLLSTLPNGETLQVCIGSHWTAVVAEIEGERRCGLASSLTNECYRHGEPDVPQAGHLETLSGLELAELAQSEQPVLASVGVAAINALIPPQPDAWVNLNAEEVIAKHGEGKTVVLIGHFPFVPRLRTRVGELIILEKRPEPGDLPADAAFDIIPEAGVVAITGTTLINHSLDGLLKLCSPQAHVILLGPSTHLSPVLFDYDIDLLCGSIVTAIEPVLRTVMQAGNFPQVHHAGVRLVSMARP
ncbi:MAG: DUF364 domain-containing protein, partial [Chloroflexota bacterium]|nr:DUF364 domain-containing protein [Chloroflexota bacterium]